MKLALLSAALSTVLLSGVCAHAQEAGVFDKWLNERSPTCVPVSELKTVSTLIELTPDQFQFVRALYVALPPVSRILPPGDKAIMTKSGDAVMLALVADGRSCARFLAPGFITAMLIQVGRGENGHIGTPVAYHPLDERPDEL